MAKFLPCISVALCLGACTPAGIVAVGTAAATIIDSYCSSKTENHAGPGTTVCHPPEVWR